MRVDMDKLWEKFWDQVELKHEKMSMENTEYGRDMARNESQWGWKQEDRRVAEQNRISNRGVSMWNRLADENTAKNRFYGQNEGMSPARKQLRSGGVIPFRNTLGDYMKSRGIGPTASNSTGASSGSGPSSSAWGPTTTISASSGSKKTGKKRWNEGRGI